MILNSIIQGNNGKPIEIDNDADMTAKLTADNVGKAYLFTGTTGTYTNGSIYVVVENGGVYSFEEYASGGGDTPPTTIGELYSKVDQLYEDAILDSYNNPVPTSIIYTNQPVTLYTPNADCIYYFIFLNTSGKYGIVWFSQTSNVSTARMITMPSTLYGTDVIVMGYLYYLHSSSYLVYKKTNDTSSSLGMQRYVSNDRYDTLSEAINAIQSSSTLYSSTPTSNWQNSNQELNTYSNTKYIKIADDFTNDTPIPLTFYELAKISENETIEVIQ